MVGSTAVVAFALALSLLGSLPRASRLTGSRVRVAAEWVRLVDGDTAVIHWTESDPETVRVLGIDTAELLGTKGRHPANERLPITPRGAEARGFARGAFAAALRIELLRSAYLDRYRRTLGYFFLDGRNYSVLVIEAGLSRETISRYGDNGLPREAKEVLDAARRSHAERTSSIGEQVMPPNESGPAAETQGKMLTRFDFAVPPWVSLTK